VTDRSRLQKSITCWRATRTGGDELAVIDSGAVAEGDAHLRSL
jgi:hypothetical protein